MTEYGLMDIWRLHNTNNKEFTYYSPYHKTYSRIDYFWINNTIIHRVTEPNIHSIIISDHVPISLKLTTGIKTQPKPRWRFNKSLLKDPNFTTYFKKEWTDFLETNNTPDITASILWETAKTVLRGKIISYSTKKKKDEMAREHFQEQEVKRLETLASRTPTNTINK